MEIELKQSKFRELCHEVRVQCEIIEGSIIPDFFEERQMKHCTKKIFLLKELDDQLLIASTDKVIVFFVKGVGANCAEAIENAKAKAMLVKEFIEEKFTCKLTMPEFTCIPHFMPNQYGGVQQ
jgi:hypothetical protein